jgi:hypothetical protein
MAKINPLQGGAWDAEGSWCSIQMTPPALWAPSPNPKDLGRAGER